jgi:two-component system, OmpR family, sensor histidine kinase CpxA
MNKPSTRLSTKILLLAIANVAALAILFVVFVRWQLGEDFESFLMTTARERIISQARSIALEMRDSEQTGWDAILAEHSNAQGVTFALYRGNGERIAGPVLDLPPQIKERMIGPPEGGRPPGDRGGFRGDGPPPGIPREVPPARVLANLGAGPYLTSESRSGGYNYWVTMRTFVPPTAAINHPTRGMLVIASPTLLTNQFFFQLWPWVGIAVAALVVSVAFWLPMVTGLTRSLTQMTEATAKIAEGDFDTQLSVKRGDELGMLGASINRMAARLGAFTHGQKRFLGDVAHELRSPLGRMQLALGILDRKVDESGASYVQDLAEDVKVMSGLTDGLLEFAKAEMRQDAVTLSATNLSEVVWRAVKAESRPGSDIQVEVDTQLEVNAESESLFRAVANVIRNAVRYAGEAGPIEILSRIEGNEVHLVIRDHGPGVPNDAVDRIFEPFYRLEYARDRESGGAGLGLAIVKSCIEACGGRVSCRNITPHGLTVEMALAKA